MFIGIDCGTQGTKAIIWQDGGILGQGYTPHSTIMEQLGQREQRPEEWFDALIASIDKAFKGIEQHKKAIKGIGISGQQHGLVLLDQNDQVIRDALLWCDTRPQAALSAFTQTHDLNLVEKLGIQVPVAFSLGKLLWVKENDPISFRRIHKMMLPHDYLNWCLTGRFTVEPGDASGTGWFDTVSKSISEELLSLIKFDNELAQPDILHSQEIVGTLHPSIAERLGLNTNVVVSSGGGDNMMAAIGTGNVGSGQLTISLGTSGTLFSHSSEQVDSREHKDLNAFCSSTNGYLPLASTMNVTTANNQILNLINSDISEFDTLLESSAIGADGLICLPFFNGARLPNVPNASGALLGITATNLTPGNLLRATVEAVTFNLGLGAKVLESAGVKFDKTCVIGGGAKSKMWRQLISDVTNLPLWCPVSTEAAAVGAAIQACWAHENLYQPTQITDICSNTLKVDEEKSVTPIAKNVQTYRTIAESYQYHLNRHMAQFV